MKTKEVRRIAMHWMVAVVMMGMGVAANGAAAAGSRMKAKAGRSTTDWRFSAGLTVPGMTTSVQARVAKIKNRLPLYVGADLDILFVGLYAYSSGVALVPMGSVTMLIPTGGIATPTVGLAMGPSILLGGAFRSSVLGFSAMFRPGVLIDLEDGMELDAQLRVGGVGGLVLFMPQVGIRFKI